MSWKDISKLSYQISATKFTLPRSSHPFTVRYQGNKLVYNEGDELTHAQYPIFNTDFTQEPVGIDHFPCGYWHRNYIPPITTIYTTKLYPAYNFEGLNIISIISGGILDATYYLFEYTENLIFSTTLLSGTLDSVYDTLDVGFEELYFNNGNIDSGILDIVYYTYSCVPENLIFTNGIISNGSLIITYIAYNYWPSESISFTSNITGGTHATA